MGQCPVRLHDALDPRAAHASAAAKSLAWMRGVATSLALGERTIRLSDFEPDVAELCGRIRRSVGEGRFAIWGFPSYIARIAKVLLASASGDSHWSARSRRYSAKHRRPVSRP
jgi:hypothetical protein